MEERPRLKLKLTTADQALEVVGWLSLITIWVFTLSNYQDLPETMINYNGKRFRAISNTDNGETSSETIFHYKQADQILTAEYSGGKISHGHLIGLVDKNGRIEMRYHQVNTNNELMTGVCQSTPEIMPNGKIRLHEVWQWTSGDNSKGNSIIEEI